MTEATFYGITFYLKGGKWWPVNEESYERMIHHWINGDKERERLEFENMMMHEPEAQA